jgi:hypothetical protein
MSRQRRSAGRHVIVRSECAEATERVSSGFKAQLDRAGAGGKTDSAQVREATKSLHSECRVVLYELYERLGAGPVENSPPRAANSPVTPTRIASTRSSPQPISNPDRSLHPFVPQSPAGLIRWTERHDGKGNMYLQHAA